MIQTDLDFHFRPGKPVEAALKKKLGLEMLRHGRKLHHLFFVNILLKI